MSNKGKIYAAILAGGIGTRFWPLSRETTPKQLLKVAGDESLLTTTIERLSPLIEEEDIAIVTSASQAEITRLHLEGAGCGASVGYIIEPCGRNTAPAIGLAAVKLLERDSDAIMVVLPSDHLMKQPEAFRRSIAAAALAASDGSLITFGIRPRSPETAYGYIKGRMELHDEIDGHPVRKVERFVEKPNLDTAKSYVEDGSYLWNSGIFVWRADAVLREYAKYLPELYAALNSIKGLTDDAAFNEIYEAIDPISIDYGILERTDAALMMEVDFAWSDLGSWNALGDALEADDDGNIIRGRVVDICSKDSIILASERVVATIGLEGFILIDTPDATLVCPKERAQEVREVVSVLKNRGWAEHETHPHTERPWGSYTVLEEGPGYKIKKITVSPGARISLQSHTKRSEHWVVVSGIATVIKGVEEIEIKTNESTFIPVGVKHRLSNTRAEPLEIIEVQNGEYVGEDDIERFDDDYKRI